MIKNYITIAIRNFWRNKIFSIINIAGLAIGISAALVIYLIAHYEFSYEKFQEDENLIYRVVTDDSIPGYKNSGVPGPLPAAVRSEIPGIEKSTVFWQANTMKVTVPSEVDSRNAFEKQNDIIYADEQYFRLFHYQWLAGSPDNSLIGPDKVVLTESRAKTYFSYSDIRNAVGQTIVYDDSIKAIVTGIVKDLNEITDFTFKEFISLSTVSESLNKNKGWDYWGAVYSNSQFFIKLQKGIDEKKIDLNIAGLRKKHDISATGHFLEPLSDIHFNSEYDAFDHRQAHKPTLYGLLAIAAFLLLLGCINFINLTTAHAVQRAKEIGIRKTMGGSKKQLMIQFLTETVLLTSLATVLSILLIPSILKIFAVYIPEGLHFDLLHQPNVILFTIILILAVSFLSGLYPAMILSGYKPALVLKNQVYINTDQSRSARTRKMLTVTQFIVAQFFIIATLVVGKQIRYSLTKDLGYRKDAIINFNTPYNYKHPDNRQDVLKEKLKSIAGIQQISLSSRPPALDRSGSATSPFKKNGKIIEITTEQISVDTAYINLYKLKLLAGRNFEQNDTVGKYIVNEAFIKLLGFTNPDSIIDKSFHEGHFSIIGVLADFHTRSLHKPIQPIELECRPRNTTFNIALPLASGNTDAWKATIAKIGKAYKEVFPEEDFNYSFFDETIAKFYKKDRDTARLAIWSMGLTIFISCLGLLGLVIYTTSQRRKEIGVRKVLGASVPQIVSLISADFIRLVILAFIIAIPFGWWAMHKWLENFAFRTTISWWIFALSGSLMLLVALLTLSIQTIRSATANPVKSLRTE